VATVLDSFITKFRFEADRGGISKVTRSLNTLHSRILKIGASIFAVFGGGRLFGELAQNLDELGKFADEVGLSVKQLQELEFVAERSGVSVQSLRSSIEGLNRVIGQAARGQGQYNEILGRYGVTIRDQNGRLMSTFNILRELNSVFNRLTRIEQFDLAQNLGINPTTIKLLQLAPREFDQLVLKSRKLGLATKHATVLAAKFEDQLTDLKQVFFSVGTELAVSVLPFFTKTLHIVESVIKALEKHGRLIRGIVVALGAILSAKISGALIASIFRLIVALKSLSKLRTVLALSLINPFTVLAAAIGVTVLAVQDLWAGFRGGRSVIIDFIKHSETIQHVWSSILDIFSSVKDFFSTVFTKAKAAEKKVLTLGASLPDFLKINASFTSLPNNILANSIAPATISPTNAVTVNVGDINISAPSGNPQDIAQTVVGEIQNQLKSSIHDFDSSIAR